MAACREQSVGPDAAADSGTRPPEQSTAPDAEGGGTHGGSGAAVEGEMGFVTVTASEPAAVLIDGQDIGQRTPARHIPMPPGRHQVQARFDGTSAPSAPREVFVRAGESTSAFFRRPEEGSGAGSGQGTGSGTGQASPR